VNEPLQALWAALETHGCRPRGKPHDFRARCPGHGGQSRDSLHASTFADGRAVLWCLAYQCDVETIVDAIGLTVTDLFPDGHHRARRLQPRPLKRSDFSGSAHTLANVLYALEQTSEPWQLMITTKCPSCGGPGAWVRARSAGTVLANGYTDPDGRVDADCPSGCDAYAYTQALLGRLAALKDKQ
jgi:hypothetical protein